MCMKPQKQQKNIIHSDKGGSSSTWYTLKAAAVYVKLHSYSFLGHIRLHIDHFCYNPLRTIFSIVNNYNFKLVL